MEPKALKCPSCGASLEGGFSATKCTFCGSAIALERAKLQNFEEEQRQRAAESYGQKEYKASAGHWENVLRCSPDDILAQLRLYQCAVSVDGWEEDILSYAYQKLISCAPSPLKERIVSIEQHRINLEKQIRNLTGEIHFSDYPKDLFNPHSPKSLFTYSGSIRLLLAGLLFLAGIALLAYHFFTKTSTGFISWGIPLITIYPFVLVIVLLIRNVIISNRRADEIKVQRQEKLGILYVEQAALLEEITAIEISNLSL